MYYACAGLSRVLVAPDTTVARAGDWLFLPCVVYSDSQQTNHSLTLSWKRGNTVLQNSSNTVIREFTVNNASSGEAFTLIKSVLELRDVGIEDAGLYSCVASRGIEEQDSAPFQVDVLTAPGMC